MNLEGVKKWSYPILNVLTLVIGYLVTPRKRVRRQRSDALLTSAENPAPKAKE